MGLPYYISTNYQDIESVGTSTTRTTLSSFFLTLAYARLVVAIVFLDIIYEDEVVEICRIIGLIKKRIKFHLSYVLL